MSLVHQDFIGKYEIVVVDDGSTDGSTDDILSLDSKIRLIKQENRGAAVARHVGILNSKYDIIVFQDADDIALPNKISVLAGALINNKDCVASFAAVKDENNVEILTSQILDMPFDKGFFRVIEPFSLMLKNLSPLALSMNLATWKHLALEASSSREFYKAANDYDFQLRLSRQGIFLFANEITNIYSTNTEGITSKYGNWRQLYYAATSAHNAILELNDKNIYKDYICEGMVTYVPRAMVNFIVCGDYSYFFLCLQMGLNYFDSITLLRRMWWELDETPYRNLFLIKILKFIVCLIKNVSTKA